MTRQETHERLVHNIAALELNSTTAPTGSGHNDDADDQADQEDDSEQNLPAMSPYHISKGTRDHTTIQMWLSERDAVKTNFNKNLRDHLLARIFNREDYNNEFSQEERNRIQFKRDRLNFHPTIRFNYTTYDMRRAQDVVNAKKPDIMLMANEDNDPKSNLFHPYWYARVVKIFHVDARYNDPGAPGDTEYTRFDVLFVRWFARDIKTHNVWKTRRLIKVSFLPFADDDSLGFVDPSRVVRGCHIVPNFVSGCTNDFLPPSSVGRPLENDNYDYLWYYVNIFADRDIFMRFLGGGVGHIQTYNMTAALANQDAVEQQDQEDVEEEQPSGDDLQGAIRAALERLDELESALFDEDFSEEEAEEDRDGSEEGLFDSDIEQGIEIDTGHTFDNDDPDGFDEADDERLANLVALVGLDQL